MEEQEYTYTSSNEIIVIVKPEGEIYYNGEKIEFVRNGKRDTDIRFRIKHGDSINDTALKFKGSKGIKSITFPNFGEKEISGMYDIFDFSTNSTTITTITLEEYK